MVAGPPTSLDDDRQHSSGRKKWSGEPMAVAESIAQSAEQQVDKGLKAGALGLVSTTIIATASVAPAYSIAATLVFVVGAVALQSPTVAVLAFVPMLLPSIGYSELNKADPDCGTTFTWATRVQPANRLGGRLGHHRRRRAGHGQPGPGRRPVRLPAVQRQGDRVQPGQRLGAAGRRAVDRGDDLHLLPGHRGLGELPEDPAQHRAGDAGRPVEHRPRQGRLRSRLT